MLNRGGGDVPKAVDPPPAAAVHENFESFQVNDPAPQQLQSQPDKNIADHQKTSGLVIMAAETSDTAMTSDEEMVDTPSVAEKFSSNGGGEGWQVLGGKKAPSHDIKDDSMSIVSSEKSLDEFSFDSDTESEDDMNQCNTQESLFGVKPFDMDLLIDCIAKGETVLSQIEDKDVVAIVGKTGTGKSTLIQGIAGKSIHRASRETQAYDRSLEKMVFDVHDPLPGFEIGHSKISMTKSINCFSRKESPVVYMDTPGFEDTDGPEIDVATSVMLTKIVGKCRSVRFIVMVNYHSLLDDRGGSLRSILKFVRKFANGGFSGNQQSFMFLFTHSNEVHSCPNDNSSAKLHLLREVVETIQGTKDEETLDVLKCIRKSLRKNYQFVGVVNPLTTNFEKIASFAENKMKPLDSKGNIVSCGLTQTSQRKLDILVRSLVDEVDSLLLSGNLDTVRLKEVKRFFLLIEKYLCVGDVQRSVADYKELVCRHTSDLEQFVEGELTKGTCVESKESFSSANVIRLKETLLFLDALCDDFSIQCFSDMVVRKVSSFQEQVLVGSIDGMELRLNKLRAWRDFDPPSMDHFYIAVVNHLTASIQDLESDVSSFEVQSLQSGTDRDAIQAFFVNISTLQLLGTAFSAHGVHTDRVSSLASTKMHQVEQMLRAWEKKEITSSMPLLDSQDEFFLESLRSNIETLTTMAKLFQQNLHSPHLFSLSRKIFTVIATNVVRAFTETCLDFQKRLGVHFESTDYCDSSKLNETLSNLQRTSDLVSSLEGDIWKPIRFRYLSLLDETTNVLSTKSGICQRMAQSALAYGVQHGQGDGRLLLAFQTTWWFDTYLSQDKRFVVRRSSSVKHDYETRGRTVKGDFERIFCILQNVKDDALASSSELRNIKPLLGESEQLSVFGSIVDSAFLKALKDDIRKSLDAYVASRNEKWSQFLSAWNREVCQEDQDISSQNLSKINKSLDSCLAEIQCLSELDLGKNSDTFLFEADSKITESLNNFAKHVHNGFDSDMEFDDAYKTLMTLQALGRFPFTSKHLPSFDEYLNLIRTRVASLSHGIGSMVEETAEIENTEQLLAELTKAQILTPFLEQDLSNHVAALSKLLTKKEGDVDEVIVSMIEKQNFQGMKEFLLPLSKTPHQVRRTKYNQYISKIQASLRAIEDTLTKAIERPTTERNTCLVAENIETLEVASSEIGALMLTKFDINSRLISAKTKIQRKLSSMLDKLEAATDGLDFVVMTNLSRKTTLYTNHLGSYLPSIIKSKQTKCVQKCNDLVTSFEPRIKRFVESEFVDHQELATMLDSLHSVDDTELHQLYSKTFKSLERHLNEALKSKKALVATYETYDVGIEAMQRLRRALDNGVGRHVPPNLVDDISELLRSWQAKRQQLEAQLDFRGASGKKNLSGWAIRLEKLKRSSWIGVDRWYERSYLAELDKLRLHMKDLFARAERSLIHRDYARMQDQIEILNQMKEHLGKHFPGLDKRILLWKSRLRVHFVSHCQSCIASLQAEDCIEFQRLFPDYRDCLLYAACRDWSNNDVKKNYSLIHQLLYELLDKKINTLLLLMKTFKFREIKASILDVRAFGSFVADNFSMLRQQMEDTRHLETDKWLDDLVALIHKHFASSRDLGGIKYFTILGIPPSSSEDVVKKAYKSKCMEYHPDKNLGREGVFKEKFEQAKDAYEELGKRAEHSAGTANSEPFDEEIKELPSFLRVTVKEALGDQNYEQVESLHFKFPELRLLKTLVKPHLDTQAIHVDTFALVTDHVQKVRTSIDSSWKERKYKELNDSINDLKSMEGILSAEVFGDSWSSSGMIETIKEEIQFLAQESRQYLTDKTSATEQRDDFRRSFMGMGAVMVELPLFKAHCRIIMSDVLAFCLSKEWGYEYLFDFGNRLKRDSDDLTDDEKRITHVIMNEFSTFKDVMTMIWNEEVEQKPADVTVPEIRVQNLADNTVNSLGTNSQDYLIGSFKQFDEQYQSLLNEYLEPDKEISILVQKLISISDGLKPVSCRMLTSELKAAIPGILAGVFTVFTLLKSGESFNRLRESSLVDAFKVLMRPHNIQVQTLLAIFGCEEPSVCTLQSRFMQIRTGEGKSMILGAASLVLSLLGFSVRCVCYSEYLSTRDYEAFREVFEIFGLASSIKYSKITTLSEDTTASKGDLRGLTLSLVRGGLKSRRGISALPATHQRATIDRIEKVFEVQRPALDTVFSCDTDSSISQSHSQIATEIDFGSVYAAGDSALTVSASKSKTTTTLNVFPKSISPATEEILLIDEVDVFFSSEFYGNTYNKAALLREPAIVEMLKKIWAESNQGTKRLKLALVKQFPCYTALLQKFPGFDYLFENEVRRMLDEVRRLDETPYHLDITTDRIGHKILDTIDYDVNFGYTTVFAYLKESENLKDPEATLNRELVIKVSCGQFSYANIAPTAILGVSGTLKAMDRYEKSVLRRYGVGSFFYLPSVYGDSRFDFNPVADHSSVLIEQGMNAYFHKITQVVVGVTKNKRAVIVFFADTERLNQFISSPFYRKLGRSKNILRENMSTVDKEFVIQRAATVGQITISSAVFGRGTDFFCKDENVESNGGVHVVQAFLSSDLSEEIQIQGRTARQGKKGTYSMVLLKEDLKENFGADVEHWPRSEYYKKLNEVRQKCRETLCRKMDINLANATAKDQASREYFDALLNNDPRSVDLFKCLYLDMKKQAVPDVIHVDLCFAVDNTGSMRRYGQAIKSTISSLIQGNSSFVPKLKVKFPDTEFKIHLGLLAYRDIDDGTHQFNLCTTQFTENSQGFMQQLDQVLSMASGGGDICEDHLGAIQHVSALSSTGCWESTIKSLLLITDAPGHGCLPQSYSSSADAYNIRHPSGLTAQSVVGELLKRDVDLLICSLNPEATAPFEEEIIRAYSGHVENREEREVISVPLVQKNPHLSASPGAGSHFGSNKHIVFVLDESGSMQHDWPGVVVAYTNYLKQRLDQQLEMDLVSVVQFGNGARVTVRQTPIASAPDNLPFLNSGTAFSPAALEAHSVAVQTPRTHTPMVVFMSDGATGNGDAQNAANTFVDLNNHVKSLYGDDLELHVIGFGGGSDTFQLGTIAAASPKGSLHAASGTAHLSDIFLQIAGGGNVASVLEEEIGKRIYDAVTDRLSAEYAG